MPSAYQTLRRDLQQLIRLCLEHQKTRRFRVDNHRIHVSDVLNEVVEEGLKCYAKKYGIQLPEIKNGGKSD